MGEPRSDAEQRAQIWEENWGEGWDKAVDRIVAESPAAAALATFVAEHSAEDLEAVCEPYEMGKKGERCTLLHLTQPNFPRLPLRQQQPLTRVAENVLKQKQRQQPPQQAPLSKGALETTVANARQRNRRGAAVESLASGGGGRLASGSGGRTELASALGKRKAPEASVTAAAGLKAAKSVERRDALVKQPSALAREVAKTSLLKLRKRLPTHGNRDKEWDLIEKRVLAKMAARSETTTLQAAAAEAIFDFLLRGSATVQR